VDQKRRLAGCSESLEAFEIDMELFLQFVMDRNFFLFAAFFPGPDK
jgi:hypothetical protein